MQIDFEVSGGGTVYLFEPLTPAARAWVEEHLPTRPGGSARSSSSTDTSARSLVVRARGAVMERLCARTEAWIVCAQSAAGELRALDESPNLMAWFEREYEWPALHADEGGQG